MGLDLKVVAALRVLTGRGALVLGMAIGAAVVPVGTLRGQEAAAGAAPAVRPVEGASAASAAGAGGGRGGGGRGGLSPGAGPVRVGGRGGAGGGQFGAASTLGEGPTCTLDATIYDVRVPTDQIGRLDVEALSKAAATAEGFEKVLAGLGTVQPLYRANQSVRLGGDSITIATDVPLTMSAQAQAGGFGGGNRTVTYRNVGAIFAISGKAGAGGNMTVDLNLQVATQSEGTTVISGEVKAAVFRTAALVYKGPVEGKQPFVVMSVDGATVDASGKAVAYIARVTLGVPRGE